MAIHAVAILALLPYRCSLPAATPPISVDLVRLDDPPTEPPAPPLQDAPSARAEAEDDPAPRPAATSGDAASVDAARAAGRPEPRQDAAGPAPAPKPAEAGWIPPFSVGQSPLSDAARPSEVAKPPPPPGGEAVAAGSDGQARFGLPFEILTSDSDAATMIPAPIEPAPDAGQQRGDEAQPLSEAAFTQRLADYGAMLNGRMRWQLTGKLPGVVPFTIVVTIELDGTISSATVTQSTGVPDVDRQALQRVLALSPLPPPPIRLEDLRLQGRAFPQQ
ncbi:hypothetical protein P409_26810 [Inquilinus limosus MP06]|uniref:TonB C-terminal domain-containing protein n=1 Tax=Inquilinus limosus MP06 TaxID=1398085 RepID=A0A0A0D391_9PROT|nr:hypothetical protein P409_26810 [Inquilinus limosus MP06]